MLRIDCIHVTPSEGCTVDLEKVLTIFEEGFAAVASSTKFRVKKEEDAIHIYLKKKSLSILTVSKVFSRLNNNGFSIPTMEWKMVPMGSAMKGELKMTIS